MASNIPPSLTSMGFDKIVMCRFYQNLVDVSESHPNYIRSIAPLIGCTDCIMRLIKAVGGASEHIVREAFYLANLNRVESEEFPNSSAMERYQVLAVEGLKNICLTPVGIADSMLLTVYLMVEPAEASQQELNKYN